MKRRFNFSFSIQHPISIFAALKAIVSANYLYYWPYWKRRLNALGILGSTGFLGRTTPHLQGILCLLYQSTRLGEYFLVASSLFPMIPQMFIHRAFHLTGCGKSVFLPIPEIWRMNRRWMRFTRTLCSLSFFRQLVFSTPWSLCLGNSSSVIVHISI